MSNFDFLNVSSSLYSAAPSTSTATESNLPSEDAINGVLGNLGTGASPISIAIAVFSVVGTIVIAFSVLPQTIKTFKDRQTQGLSFLLFFLTGLATAFLTIYGCSLVAANPASYTFLIKDTLGKAYQTQDGFLIFNYQEWVAGFLVPGIFLIGGELLCSITSFMTAFLIIYNKRKASSMGMTHAEYCLSLKSGKAGK
ncbi:PQ-loop repeat-containing protein [Ureaplasma canigenitalium]|uniref:PQ-loop repeat-containing protein n=1 Tax=Ureaplasma canigenitalium TaxID=42092 RepID=UPI00068AAE40|nr:PQ-loop repeat-containing protein [Ureaplasma canigenitalium]